jgi:CheY-like chemotaxis protein
MTTPRVLIAETDLGEVEQLRTLFRAHGYTVVTVSGGIDCLKYLRLFKPDVLVIHENLLWGGTDGVLACVCEDGSTAMAARVGSQSLIVSVSKEGKTTCVPVVVILTDRQSDVRADSFDSNVVSHQKPVCPPVLLEAVRVKLGSLPLGRRARVPQVELN